VRLIQPAEIIPPPRDHQKEALRFIEKKENPEFAGLFMEPGTGKTKTAILRVAKLYREKRIDVALIWAPNGVHAQWIEEQAVEHCPVPYRTVVWSSNRSKRWKDQTLYTLKKTDALILVAMNWEALTTKDGVNFCRWLMKQKRVALVADESSRIRNPKAIRTKTALNIAPEAAHRMILTGTPLVKGFENLWSQLTFLSPDILRCRTFIQFRSLYCKLKPIIGAPRGAMQITGYQRVDELMSKIKPHVFVKTKKECLDLPDKIPIPSPVPLTDAQAEAYETMRDELLVQLSELEVVTVAHLISARAKLRQISIGFILDKDKKATPLPSHRWERTLEHLEEAPGKTILWTSFRWCLGEWERLLAKHRIGFVRYQKGDNESIRQWKRDPKTKVFLGNPHSGGIGLNLAEADTMIFFNNVDDLEIRLQAEDRAHRIGQTKHLSLIDLYAPDTVETKMQKQQKEKMSLVDIVMRGDWRDAL
jgi:SNF2 family DNA or RNA helicase